VDSSYYAIPDVATVRHWVERTPPSFVFDVKAFSLFTLHPTQRRALPPEIARQIPADKASLFYAGLPEELREATWEQFRAAMKPLAAGGKLGAILLQFPRWVLPSKQNREYILAARDHLAPMAVTVEFRNAGWMSSEHVEDTLEFLRENSLPYVCVDEPQGFDSSVPPLAEATANLAVVRFHGRNASTWEKPGLRPSQRFDWYYQLEEMQEWLPRIQRLADRVGEIHLLMNTNHKDQGIVNARLLQSILNEAGLFTATPPAAVPSEGAGGSGQMALW
jgi:uncharacterized protein YecE (DUF72 family)